MKTTIDVWALCHAFLKDAENVLTNDDFQFLTGACRARDWRKLSKPFRDVGPAYRGPQEARALSQIGALFKKNESFSSNEECLENARKAFEKGESLCRRTNRRLEHFYFHPKRMEQERQAQVNRMRGSIRRVLGNFSQFRDFIPGHVRVTAGASEQYTRERSIPYLKVRKKVSCSFTARPYVRALSIYHTGKEPRYRVVNHNRVTVVPKNSETFRTIACEPVGNLPFQLAADSYIKKRLKRLRKADLSDQSVNKEKARAASVSGEFATIDLSMASDTLAFNLVWYLLPSEWCQFFTALRSPYYKGIFGDGEYAKFSSMGNGFTFTLETLVFIAACEAVGSTEYSVYGDDIVIESSLSAELTQLLRFIGFVPNSEKSFYEGPFRESCGGDFHTGMNIRPVFVRKNECTDPELSHYINELARISDPLGEVWIILRRIMRKSRLPLVPMIEDTTMGIIVPVDMAYNLGLIHYTKKWSASHGRSPHIPYIRAIVPRRTNRKIDGVRPLLLWHFYKSAKSSLRSRSILEDVQKSIGDRVVTSVIPTGNLRYSRRLVPWRNPRGLVYPHIYMWGDFISHARKGS